MRPQKYGRKEELKGICTFEDGIWRNTRMKGLDMYFTYQTSSWLTYNNKVKLQSKICKTSSKSVKV